MVSDPIMIAVGASEMGVPEMVVPRPFGWRVVSIIARPLDLRVRVCVPMMKRVVGRVLLPLIIAEGASDIGLPETVMPGPPGDSVVPAMAKPVGLAVIT